MKTKSNLGPVSARLGSVFMRLCQPTSHLGSVRLGVIVVSICLGQPIFFATYLNDHSAATNNKTNEGQDRGTNSHATRKQRPSQINTREAVLKPTILGRPPLESSCRKQVLNNKVTKGFVWKNHFYANLFKRNCAKVTQELGPCLTVPLELTCSVVYTRKNPVCIHRSFSGA